MFKLNHEMAKTARMAASRNRCRTFGTSTALGHELVFEAQLYQDNWQPLAINLHVTKNGKLIEPFTTLTTRVSAYERPLEGDEIIVPAYDNEFLRAPLFDAGLFCDSSKRVALPFGEAEIWKMLPKFVYGFRDAYPEFIPPPTCLLPPWCFSFHPSPKKRTEIVRIERGMPGFKTVARCFDDDEALTMLRLMNVQTHATDLETWAMLNGSLFGWDVPGANPEHLARTRAATPEPTRPAYDQ